MFNKTTDSRGRNWYVITIDNRRYTIVVNSKTRTVSSPRYRENSKVPANTFRREIYRMPKILTQVIGRLFVPVQGCYAQ